MDDSPDVRSGVVDGEPVLRGDAGAWIPAAFCRTLRSEGVEVPVDATVAFGRSLGLIGLHRRALVYWAGRATLIHGPEDVAAYDRAFASFWRGAVPLDDGAGPETVAGAPDRVSAGPEPLDGDQGSEPRELSVVASGAELLGRKDFAACTPEELDEAQRLIRTIHLQGVRRPSRRWRGSGRRSGRSDIRRTMRDAVRHHGDIPRPRYFGPITKPRRVVLLCDVSASMEVYSRPLLRLLHVAVAGRRDVEAFALGTRLTRLTRALDSHDPDAALAAAAAAADDRSGGTRLGESLREFNERFGVRGMARGAVVVILSDGWDRGDPAVLGREMARLQRVAFRVVWVNPLKASPGYAPLTGGMAAALPHVDSFLEGHSLDSLRALAGVIGSGGAGSARAR